MSFNRDEFLRLARSLRKGLIEECSQEAVYRTAVNRAYYADFGYARNYAQKNLGFKPAQTAKEHTLIRKCFQQQGNPNIARRLYRLRQNRNACDYDDVVQNLSKILRCLLNNAQEIF